MNPCMFIKEKDILNVFEETPRRKLERGMPVTVTKVTDHGIEADDKDKNARRFEYRDFTFERV